MHRFKHESALINLNAATLTFPRPELSNGCVFWNCYVGGFRNSICICDPLSGSVDVITSVNICVRGPVSGGGRY